MAVTDVLRDQVHKIEISNTFVLADDTLTIRAAVAGVTLRVTGGVLTTNSATTIKFKRGSTATDFQPRIAGNGSLVLPPCEMGYMDTTVDTEDLIIASSSGATTVSGVLWVREI